MIFALTISIVCVLSIACGAWLIVDVARNTDHQGVDITPLGK